MVQLPPFEDLPEWIAQNQFVFASRTNKELSIIAPSDIIPWDYEQRLDGRHMIELLGDFEFSDENIGITAKLSKVLANESISLCFVGTFATDYIFIKQEDSTKAKQAFINAWYIVR